MMSRYVRAAFLRAAAVACAALLLGPTLIAAAPADVTHRSTERREHEAAGTATSHPITIDPMLASRAPDGPAFPSGVDAVLQSSQASGAFGISVAEAGDVNGDGYADIIVGASSYDNGQTDEGAAFVFHGGPGGIGDHGETEAAAVLESNQAGALLGGSVAGAGDLNGDGFDDVIVGAPAYDHGQVNEGAAFVFYGGPGGIGNRGVEEADAILESNQTNAGLGFSVAGAGDLNGDGFDDIVVGAYAYSTDGNGNAFGAAFTFHGAPGGIISNGNPNNSNGVLEGDRAGEFGFSVAGAGDVNGDGFDDIVVAAPGYLVDSRGSFIGAAFVFHGGPAGVGDHTESTANATVSNDQTSGGVFAGSVDGAGDVDGDGFDDIVVGAVGYVVQDLGFAGAAFVFHGSLTGIGSRSAASADARLIGDVGGTFGESVAGAGDVNGDHFDDIIVGESNRQAPITSPSVVDGSSSGLGGAFVFFGGPTGIGDGGPASADLAYESDQDSSLFGRSVAGVGDTNGDALSEFAVGAPFYGPGVTHSGAAFVFSAPVVAGGTGGDTPGVYMPTLGTWFLKNTNAPGPADLVFGFAAGGHGLVPIKGDWNGDGVDTPGVYDPGTSTFFLKNSNAPGPAEIVFGFGAPGFGFVPITGDWDHDGRDTVGLYSPSAGVFFLRNTATSGPADVTFQFGAAAQGFVPIAGDWDHNGTDTVGLYQPATGTFFLKNLARPGAADVSFQFGAAAQGFVPLAGDWDNDGADTVGLYEPATGTFFLTNVHAPGDAALVFGYGAPNLTPLAGDWDGL